MKISDDGVRNLATAILYQAVCDYNRTKGSDFVWESQMKVWHNEVRSSLRGEYAAFMAETIGVNKFTNWVREKVA